MRRDRAGLVLKDESREASEELKKGEQSEGKVKVKGGPFVSMLLKPSHMADSRYPPLAAAMTRVIAVGLTTDRSRIGTVLAR